VKTTMPGTLVHGVRAMRFLLCRSVSRDCIAGCISRLTYPAPHSKRCKRYLDVVDIYMLSSYECERKRLSPMPSPFFAGVPKREPWVQDLRVDSRPRRRHLLATYVSLCLGFENH